MKWRKASVIAWPAAAGSVLLFIVGYIALLMGVDVGEDTDALGGALWMLSWVGFPTVGAIIAARRPRHPVGWLLVGIGVGISVMLAGNIYAYRGLVAAPGSLPAATVVAWASQLAFIPAVAAVPFLILLFPSGRIPSRRMRLVALAGGMAFAGLFLLYAVRDVVELGSGRRISSPFAIEPLAPLIEGAIPTLFAAALLFTIATMGHAVWRMWRAGETERRQLKWFAYAIAAWPVLMAVGIAASAWNRLLGDVVITAAFFVSLNGMAVAIAIAIFRYRLYEIDRIVSRTLAYAAITASLVSIYLLVVLMLGGLLRPITGGDDLAVAASTLAAAAAFRPIRRRVQSLVDRRFNRSSYDAQRTIETFAARLRDEIDIGQLRRDLEAVVHETMQPAHVTLWAPARETA